MPPRAPTRGGGGAATRAAHAIPTPIVNDVVVALMEFTVLTFVRYMDHSY